jgi:thiol-disulfide isomerase/thioredoxin
MGGMDDGQAVTTTLVPKGAFQKTGYFQALGIEVSETKPDSVKKVPDGLKAPKYAILRFGDFTTLNNNGQPDPKVGAAPADAPTFVAILDEPEGEASRFFVDTNRDGDLTNDPATEWTARDEKGMDGADLKSYSGSAAFDLGTADKPRVVNFGFFRFDKKDQQRAQVVKYLIAYRDYLATADVKFGDKTYPVMLSDERATGDFRGRAPEAKPAADPANPEAAAPADPFASGVTLLIDVNGNGRIDYKGEAFDVRQPFNIGGTTYELADVAADGGSFKLVKATKTVAEIKPPPDHAEGKKITSFEATLMDGKKVKFPEDYKGKVVMIDFWATWCHPCMMEVPNVAAAYEKLHGQGFDVLGVTLDQKDALEKVKTVTAQNKMVWPQIFEGKGWQTSLAELYAVTGIPACWLVDGDTGLIVADESKLRGEQLTGTVEKALADKKAKK